MTAPALFIGLGGTGKQTLMHLRRLILDNYGAGVVPKSVLDRYGSGRLPHTAFLCFDSDPRLLDLDGQRFDELLAGAALSGDDIKKELAKVECPVLLILDACHSADRDL